MTFASLNPNGVRLTFAYDCRRWKKCKQLPLLIIASAYDYCVRFLTEHIVKMVFIVHRSKNNNNKRSSGYGRVVYP